MVSRRTSAIITMATNNATCGVMHPPGDGTCDPTTADASTRSARRAPAENLNAPLRETYLRRLSHADG